MLEIKTISNQSKLEFDAEVNAALRDGWELVKRDCLILGADRSPYLYAELERVIDEPEDMEEGEADDLDGTARWLISRNPQNPYKCSHCGYTANLPWGYCPNCKSVMLEAEER